MGDSNNDEELKKLQVIQDNFQDGKKGVVGGGSSVPVSGSGGVSGGSLEQYVDLCNKLRDENSKLREEMFGRDADSLQVVDFLRKEVDKKQEQIITLKRTLENQRRQIEAEAKS